jgi:hypothetical protein
MNQWTAEEKMPALNNGLLSPRQRASSLPKSDSYKIANQNWESTPSPQFHGQNRKAGKQPQLAMEFSTIAQGDTMTSLLLARD